MNDIDKYVCPLGFDDWPSHIKLYSISFILPLFRAQFVFEKKLLSLDVFENMPLTEIRTL